jgi:hypothetical protein
VNQIISKQSCAFTSNTHQVSATKKKIHHELLERAWPS